MRCVFDSMNAGIRDMFTGKSTDIAAITKRHAGLGGGVYRQAVTFREPRGPRPGAPAS